MDEFGAVGYLAYFGIIEIICKENGHNLTGKLTISPTYLRRKLRISQAKLRQVYDFCQTFSKLSFNFSEKLWDFEFPKIAEIKDNYTRDLEVSTKKVSIEEEEEVEEEKEEEEEIVKPPSPKQFFEAWNCGVGSLLPKARDLTKARKIKVKQRLQERSLPEWEDIFKRIIKSKFCCGDNDRGWKASFDWIIANEDNAVKVLEGKYDNKGEKPPKKKCTKEEPMPEGDRLSEWSHPDITKHPDSKVRAAKCKYCSRIFQF